MTNPMATQVKSKEQHTAARTTGLSVLYNQMKGAVYHAYHAMCMLILHFASWSLLFGSFSAVLIRRPLSAIESPMKV